MNMKNLYLKLKQILSTPKSNNDNSFEILIMKSDGTVLKRLQSSEHLPRVNDHVYISRHRYQVKSNIFNYNLNCINIWVD